MTVTHVETVDAGPRTVSRSVVVNAPAHDLFTLLADPHRHSDVDGSGTVRNTVSGPRRLTHGARFSVAMKLYGIPYRITSTVTAIEEDRLVEWQHPAGHRWRWQFAEVENGRTQVTETFDYSTVRAPWLLELIKAPERNVSGIEKTLSALCDRFSR
jgi:hypothetical protein